MIINELTDETREIIRFLVNKISKIKGKKIKRKKIAEITTLTDDDVEYILPIYLSSDSEFQAYVQDISKDPEVFMIEMVINPNLIESKRDLYNKIYHEFLHATDPKLTSRQGKEYLEKYNSNSNKGYYSSKIELRAIVGEFLEALRNQVKEFTDHKEDGFSKNDLISILDNILGYFLNKKKIEEKTLFFINRMNDENVSFFKRKDLEKAIESFDTFHYLKDEIDDEEFPDSLLVLNLLKTYNKKGWEIFLNLLKSEISDIKKKLKE